MVTPGEEGSGSLSSGGGGDDVGEGMGGAAAGVGNLQAASYASWGMSTMALRGEKGKAGKVGYVPTLLLAVLYASDSSSKALLETPAATAKPALS